MTDGRFHGPKDYLDLARSSNACPDELRRLAASVFPFVVEAVAQNPSTPADVLNELVPATATSWDDQRLLLALSRNSTASEPTLRKIAPLVGPSLHLRDPRAGAGFAAGIALFERADTPDDLLMDLLADAQVTTEFRKVAARQTTHHPVLNHLASDRSERVRRAAQARIQQQT